MTEPTWIVNADTLRDFCTQVFEKLAIAHSDAEIASEVLVSADLRGVDSYGVARLSRSLSRNLERLTLRYVTPVKDRINSSLDQNLP